MTQKTLPGRPLRHPVSKTFCTLLELLTVGTKIIADPEKCFQELISEKSLIFLRDGPCLELIIVSSNFQALLLLQDILLNRSESD